MLWMPGCDPAWSLAAGLSSPSHHAAGALSHSSSFSPFPSGDLAKEMRLQTEKTHAVECKSAKSVPPIGQGRQATLYLLLFNVSFSKTNQRGADKVLSTSFTDTEIEALPGTEGAQGPEITLVTQPKL